MAEMRERLRQMSVWPTRRKYFDFAIVFACEEGLDETPGTGIDRADWDFEGVWRVVDLREDDCSIVCASCQYGANCLRMEVRDLTFDLLAKADDVVCGFLHSENMFGSFSLCFCGRCHFREILKMEGRACEEL